jgi:Tfp pilus assembly protein PilF
MNALIRRQPVLPALLIFGAALCAYWTATHNDFVGFDDPVYVTGNRHVQQGLTWESVAWAFTTSEGGNWHPLTWLSHMLDCQLFGLSPWGHHFVSILIHALNAALVFLVFFQLTGATWRSFIVAGLFALHPLRVESVAWVAERKDVLSGFWFLLTLLIYGKYVSSAKDRGEQKFEVKNSRSEPNSNGTNANSSGSRLTDSVRFYLLTVVTFTMGLLSKPMLVTLPFILLLLDYWPLRRVQSGEKCGVSSVEGEQSACWRLVVEKSSFFALATISCIITMIVQGKGGAMSLSVPLFQRVENALVSYCRYVGKIFFPSNLAFFYPYQNGWPVIVIALSALLLAGISILAIVWWRRHPYLLMGWLWFLGTLIPVLGLVQVGEQALADRYTYIPSIGFLIALVWGTHELTRGWKFQGRVFGAIMVVLGVICALKTREQIAIWKDNETLFSHAIAVTQKNYIAHNNLGTTFEKQGRWDEAAAQLRQAIAEKPDYAPAHKNLGVVFERQGDSTRAADEYREAIRLDPNYAEAHNDLGALLNARGRTDEAIGEFQQALRLKPDFTEPHFNLGLVYTRKGLVDAAIREYESVLKIQPDSADVHNNLGVAFDKQGRTDDAIREYARAIELRPSYARARFNLGVALSRKGALAAAIEQFQEALKLKPDYEEARINLNQLLQVQKGAGK